MWSLARTPWRTTGPLLATQRLKPWSYWSRTTSTRFQALKTQSVSPLSPIGINAAMQAAADPTVIPKPKIFEEFSMKDKVGIVTGGNRGLGLEMALALCELGARAIYCFDLPSEPSEEWKSTRDFVKKMDTTTRFEYIAMDVRDQQGMWDRAKEIGDREGRMDVCVAAAGVTTKEFADCLTCSAETHQEVMDINTNGVLFAAQAAGQQMVRFNTPGSIILIASIAGSATLRGDDVLPYNASKSAVLQIARSMACELGSKGIRVNTISPGFMRTPMTSVFLEVVPTTMNRWSDLTPLGRIGRPDELRGVVAWLASDASSFCTGSDIVVGGGYQAW